MDINIVWIIAVLLLAAGAVKGFRKGLVEGVVRITSYMIGIIVLIVLVKGIGSFIQGSILNVLMALILLVVIRLLHRIIKLLLDSCRLVSRLPVVKWLDRLGGTLLGIAQMVCLIWALFILFGYFNKLRILFFFLFFLFLNKNLSVPIVVIIFAKNGRLVFALFSRISIFSLSLFTDSLILLRLSVIGTNKLPRFPRVSNSLIRTIIKKITTRI